MAALGARREGGAGRAGEKGIAADAVERPAPPLRLERAMIPAIIPEPESEEARADECAIDDGGGGEIEHGTVPK